MSVDAAAAASDGQADTATDVVAALDATDPNVDKADDSSPAGLEVDDADDVDGDDEGADALGDAGKKALDRMKERLRTERQARRAAEARLNEQAPADDPERIRREAREEATKTANGRIVRAEIRAAAAGKLADPADALAFIDVEQFDVDDDGSVDQDDIAEAIADLLVSKPHLAAQGGNKPPKPDRSQGATGGGTASTADQFANAIGGLI